MKKIQIDESLSIENIKDIKLFCFGEKSELFEKQVLSYFNLNNITNKTFADIFKSLFSYIRGLNENLTLMKIEIITNDGKQIEFNVNDMLYYRTIINDNLIRLFLCVLNYIIENDSIDIKVYNHNQDGYISSKLKESKRGK